MNTASLPRPDSYICLLRVWREDESGLWRVLIQHPFSLERLLFPDVLAAFAYIETQLLEAGRAEFPSGVPTSD